jgi:outer membrane biosynthesis protein TonB
MALSYEEQRKANILANQALLESLGLASAPKPKAKPRPKPKAKAAPKPTRDENEAYTDTQDSSSSADDDDSQAPKRKRQRPPPPDDGRRRSGRATRQTRRFDPGAARSDGETEDEEGGAYNGPNRRKDEPMRCAQRLGVRTQNP